MSRLLLVEDDVAFAGILCSFLMKQGHQVDVNHAVKEATRSIRQKHYDLFLLDYRLPDGDGLSLLKLARDERPGSKALIMTSFNDVRTAVRAVKSGAFDYITKPINPDELLLVVNDALNRNIDAQPEATEKPIFIQGASAASAQLLEYINLVSPTEMSVILQGESGTGKENAARSIHQLSQRSAHPFVAVDCGALTTELAASELFGHTKGAFTGASQEKKGSFEFANGGTLFLDEVGNLSYEIQVKLLRVLQEKVVQPLGTNSTIQVDVRVICATNDDLGVSVKAGRFREDLYHRLNEFKIKLPSLKEREADLDLFVKHFVSLANTELNKTVIRFSSDVMDIFRKYDWPGNLRQLKNVIRRAVLLAKSEVAGAETLPDEMTIERFIGSGNVLDIKMTQEMTEKELIKKALQESKFNKSKAAQRLNIDRKTLYNKISKYNLDQ